MSMRLHCSTLLLLYMHHEGLPQIVDFWAIKKPSRITCFFQTCQAVPVLLLLVDCSQGRVGVSVYTLFDMAQRACA